MPMPQKESANELASNISPSLRMDEPAVSENDERAHEKRSIV